MDMFNTRRFSYVVRDISASLSRVFSLSSLFTENNSKQEDESKAIARDWENIGNDLRKSILAYDSSKFQK